MRWTRSAGRRARPVLVLLSLLGLLALRPAFAEHEVKLMHVPPRIAAAKVPQPLAIVVRGTCDQECAPVVVTLTYKVGSTVRTMSETVINLDAGATTFTIPGADVVRPSLPYFIEASRRSCVRYGFCSEDCHRAVARWPAAPGSWYSVPVTEVGSPQTSSKATAEVGEDAARTVTGGIRDTASDTDREPAQVPRLVDDLRRLIRLEILSR